jgi:hypothetical protein
VVHDDPDRSPAGSGSPLPADDPWTRPTGVDDAAVDACGKLGEALEWVERARGPLYDFHQMIGRADFLFGDAAERLAEAGHPQLAGRVDSGVVGRNVVAGRWTFQLVEDFDDGYDRPVTEVEARVRKRDSGGASTASASCRRSLIGQPATANPL